MKTPKLTAKEHLTMSSLSTELYPDTPIDEYQDDTILMLIEEKGNKDLSEKEQTWLSLYEKKYT